MVNTDNMHETNEHWDTIIEADKKGIHLQIGKLFKYRDLIWMFVQKKIVLKYKQTVLGPLWFVVQPMISTVMYMFVFGSLAQIGTDNIPQILFYFSGTMLWTLFSDMVLQTANVFNENKGMFGKVYFPRLVVPIAGGIESVIKLLIQFILFLSLYIFYCMSGISGMFSWYFFLFPVVVLWVLLLALNIGMIITSITTKYRDLALILSYLVSLWMYATPVVYPLSEIPSTFKSVILINPVSVPMELFRLCLFGVGNVTINQVSVSLVELILIMVLGITLFSKNEKSFVDYI